MFLRKKNTLINDSSLWNSFLAGDEEAYSQIYKKYAKRLFLQGLQFSSDRELIQDCIHDLFVKIYESRTKLKPINNLQVYLFISLRNGIITTLKKQKVWLDELDEESTSLIEHHTVEDDFILKEVEDKKGESVRIIFSLLSDRQQEVIQYRFIQALSIEEISIIMGMNYQSVQNLLQRSIKKIRVALKKDKNK